MLKKDTLLRYLGIFCLSFLLLFCNQEDISDKQYVVRTVAFYNVENLFDTTNDTLVYDDNRTPSGKDNWTTESASFKFGGRFIDAVSDGSLLSNIVTVEITVVPGVPDGGGDPDPDPHQVKN